MTGPCLCGDPYCPSCGDPAGQAEIDAVVSVLEKAEKKIETYHEARIFYMAGMAAVREHRKAVDTIVSEQTQEADMSIDWLKDERARER